MKYAKPEVTVIDSACAAIQGGQQKVMGNFDSLTTRTATSAYEADE